MANVKKKAAGYHGIQNMRFAKRENGVYATDLLDVLYAKSLNPSALIEAVKQYADNGLLFQVPNDTGYEGELGTVAPDPELEKAAGYAVGGSNGVIATNMAKYLRGALYYEFIENTEDGTPYVVKAWMYNVEIGKGTATHTTDTNSIEFGEYKYPFTAYGEKLMDSAGANPYQDENGLGRTAYIYTARPGDEGYADFGKAVPAPKVKAAAPPSAG